jgi:hypothetical protein
MPLAKIYVHEGRYDEARLVKLGDAIQTALEETLGSRPLDLGLVREMLESTGAIFVEETATGRA